MKYCQCLLCKSAEIKGILHTVAWIPKEYAYSYRFLKLKDDNGGWNEGWLVEKVYNEADESFILKHERDWARQRMASDI